MFSGIVETKVNLLEWSSVDRSAQVKIQRPSNFKDLSIGDSIAIDGVCLTLEKFTTDSADSDFLQFYLGAETLKVTGWTAEKLKNKALNIERSLRLADRVHGHFVLGHVDAMGSVIAAEKTGENIQLTIALSAPLRPLVWRKGSVAINGISLTINNVRDISSTDSVEIELCIIPETIRRTNISHLKAGDLVTVEADQYARALQRFSEAKP